MKRIQVIGCSAAGKSTVARELGEILKIQVTHLDKEMWRSGCQLTPPHKESEIVQELLKNDQWIIDGNYTASLPSRLRSADTIVMVDYPRWVCLIGAFKRLIQHFGRSRPDMGNGCPETFNLAFLRWIWRYPSDERPVLLRQLEEHGQGAKIIRFRRRWQARRWLHALRHGTALAA